MALIKCSKCGGTVSTKASTCPHCGGASSEHHSEKQRLEKLADELGSMSAALAASESVPVRPVQNVKAAVALEPQVSPRPEPIHPKRVYTTGDYVLYSILWTAMAIFFVPGLYFVITNYFKGPIETTNYTAPAGHTPVPVGLRPPPGLKPAVPSPTPPP